MSVQELLKGVKTVAVVDLQWGDNGKGKIVDELAPHFDINVRGTGGANAGHTVCDENGKPFVFRMLPSSLLFDGKILSVLGRGVAFDPRVATEEITSLHNAHKTCKGLRISLAAALVLPQHILYDKATGKDIGTTGKGVGPAYGDDTLRRGLIVNDLLNPEVFKEKLAKNLRYWLSALSQLSTQDIREAFAKDGWLTQFSGEDILDANKITEVYLAYGKTLKEYITDTDALIANALGKKMILLEGAQGTLLSNRYGTRPFVTSSDCSVHGLASGAGVPQGAIDLVLGVVKGFYMTRVGNGPMPTELGGKQSDEWCRKEGMSKEKELVAYPHPDINSSEDFERGIAIRRAGEEYGSVTKRPRRTGDLDLPLLRYALMCNTLPNTKTVIVLTKLDVLDASKEIHICTEHEHGTAYVYGSEHIVPGARSTFAIPDAIVLSHVTPINTTMPGWQEPLGNIKTKEALPHKLKDIVHFVEKTCEAKVAAISVGKNRGQTIYF